MHLPSLEGIAGTRVAMRESDTQAPCYASSLQHASAPNPPHSRAQQVILRPSLQIQLTVEETQGAAAASKQELLQLVEMLVQAGAPCNRFLTEHWPAAAAARAACRVAGAAGAAGAVAAGGQRPPALVFPSLLLAAGLPSWSPSTHRQWPPAFCSAAREALLVLRGRGVAAAAERVGGGQTHMQRGGAAGQHVQLHLPVEICHMILQKAASAVSCWVGP